MYVNLVVYNLVCYLALFYAEFFYMSISVRVSIFFFSVPLTTGLVTSSAFGEQPRFYCFHEFHFAVAFR